MNRKSQIMLFLIFSVIFVVIFFYFTFSQTEAKEEKLDLNSKVTKKSNLDREIKELKSYFQICLDMVFQKAIFLSGFQGGFISFEGIDGRHMYFDNYIDFSSVNEKPIDNFDIYISNIGASSVLINSFYFLEVPKENSKLFHKNSSGDDILYYNKSITDDIKGYISNNYLSCLENISSIRGIENVNYSNVVLNESINISFAKNEVIADLEFPLFFISEKENSSIFFENIISIIEIPYKSFLDLTEKVLTEKSLNRSLNFSDILELESIESSSTNSFQSLDFYEVDVYFEEDMSQKLLAFKNDNLTIFGKPFIYQFGYYNSAPYITSINLSSTNSITKPEIQGENIDIFFKEDEEFEYDIYFYDKQVADINYTIGTTQVSQIFIEFNDFNQGDNYIRVSPSGELNLKLNTEVFDRELVISDGEAKNTYLIDFKKE